MAKEHAYQVKLRWSGNKGAGTSGYRDYDRSHLIAVDGKTEIPGSSDPSFLGDRTRWNPEELLVASVSACHQLWYLHLCAVAGVIVTAYEDVAEGVMVEEQDGSGQFAGVTLRPRVTITAGSDAEKARELHHAANENCFVARSVKFTIAHEPTILVEED